MMAADGTGDQRYARRAAGVAIAAERMRHEYGGQPDWEGQSRGYRQTIEAAYREAGVPTDSEEPVLHAGLRHHVRDEVSKARKRLDLSDWSPEAPTSLRKTVDVDLSPRAPTNVFEALESPVALVKTAIRALEAARDLKPRGDDAETVRYILPAILAAVDGLAAVVDGDAKF